MMDARASDGKIRLSVEPLQITSSDPDMEWLRGKLAAAGWNERRAREVKGPITVSFLIAAPPPPAGLSKRKAAILAAGGVVPRSSGLPANVLAGILIRAMRLRPVQVARLHVDKVFSLAAGHIDITIETLA